MDTDIKIHMEIIESKRKDGENIIVLEIGDSVEAIKKEPEEITSIEKNGYVIVVDQYDNIYKLEKTDRGLVPELKTPDEVKSYISNNTTYSLEENDELPIEVSHSFHLEYTFQLDVAREYGDIQKLFGRNSIQIQSIDLKTNWKVYGDGKADLESIEYGGETYTSN